MIFWNIGKKDATFMGTAPDLHLSNEMETRPRALEDGIQERHIERVRRCIDGAN
jgi:hypothetical protein